MIVSGADNQAAADRVVLNVNPALEAGARFTRGEILRGIVEEIKADGIISLLIKGKLINAVSEVNVSRGQNLYLLVDGYENNLTHLKLITTQGLTEPDDINLSVNLRSIDVDPNPDIIMIARKLLQHDLPVNQQNIAEILKAMDMVGGISARNLEAAIFALEHNVPFDKNIFPLINQFISSDGDLSRLIRELIQLLARMETIVRSDSASPAAPSAVITSGSSNQTNAAITANTAIPIPANTVIPTNATIAAGVASQDFTGTGAEQAAIPKAVHVAAGAGINAEAFISTANAGQQGNAASFITASITPPVPSAATVSAAASSTTPAGVNPEAAASLNADVPAAEPTGGGTGSTNNTPVVPGSAPAVTGAAGTETAAVGAALNTAVSAAVTSANAAHASSVIFQPPVNLDSAAAKEAKPIDLMEAVKILRAVLDSSVGKIAGSSHEVNPILQNLIKDRTALLNNLRRLVDVVKSNEMLTKTPEGQELLTRISNLHQEITGQALFNSAVKLDQDVFTNSYYFSFPVEIDKELSYCQLRIQKNTSSKLAQQDNIKLVVSLDTPALGIVIFHIDWYRQGFIQLQGVTETDEAGNFIKENMMDLLIRLNELGYKANNLGVKVAEKPEELILKPLIKETEHGQISPYGIDVIV